MNFSVVFVHGSGDNLVLKKDIFKIFRNFDLVR